MRKKKGFGISLNQFVAPEKEKGKRLFLIYVSQGKLAEKRDKVRPRGRTIKETRKGLNM